MDTLLASSVNFDTLKGIIYVIVNFITDKVYVGQSQTSFEKRYPKGWWLPPHMCNSELIKDAEKYGIENFYVFIFKSDDLNKNEQDLINSFENNKSYTLYNGLKKHANYGPKRGQRKRFKIGFRSHFQTAGFYITDEILELSTVTSCGKTKDGHAAKSNAKLSKSLLEARGVSPSAEKLESVTSIIDKIITELPNYGYKTASVPMITNNLRQLTNGIARNIENINQVDDLCKELGI